MCIGSDKRKPFGFLFKNQQNQFSYSCSQCDEEFGEGVQLEKHTIVHIVKEEELSCDPPTIIFESFTMKSPIIDALTEDNLLPLDELSTKNEMAIYLPVFETPRLGENLLSEPTEQNSVDEPDEVFDNNKIDSESSSCDESAFDGKQLKTKKPKGVAKRREFICELCQRSFTSLARIRQHIHASHVNDKKKQSKRSQTMPVVCSLCGKSIRDMKTHLKFYHGNERPFKCTFCPASFKQKVHLDTHKRQHTGEKPFVCESCGRAYHCASVLKSHMNRYHLHLKPHKCDQCPNTYRQLYELRDHINLHHLNKKLYPCSLCDRRFGTRKHLHQHMLSHGEKKFQCKFCDLRLVEVGLCISHIHFHSLLIQGSPQHPEGGDTKYGIMVPFNSKES